MVNEFSIDRLDREKTLKEIPEQNKCVEQAEVTPTHCFKHCCMPLCQIKIANSDRHNDELR